MAARPLSECRVHGAIGAERRSDRSARYTDHGKWPAGRRGGAALAVSSVVAARLHFQLVAPEQPGSIRNRRRQTRPADKRRIAIHACGGSRVGSQILELQATRLPVPCYCMISRAKTLS